MNYWRYIEEDGVEGAYGLAGDEYIMWTYRNTPKYPSTLRLYTYRSYSALIGRFQDIKKELNIERCKELNIEINRRLTGGGAIIMGEGQLGLSLVTHGVFASTPSQIFSLYSQGILKGLDFLNLNGYLRGKNDIEVGNKKIAGLGVYLDEYGVLLFHASILIDMDFKLMGEILRFYEDKVKDKGISSYRERIITISQVLGYRVGTGEVREAIKRGFEEAFGISLLYEPFNEREKEEIERIKRDRYLKEEWIYDGESILS